MPVVINPQNCSGDCNNCRYTECVNNSKYKSTIKFQDKCTGEQDLPTGKEKQIPRIAEAITLLAVLLGCTVFAFITLKLLVQ